jgi:predicted HicB family RNase H-like nuclease
MINSMTYNGFTADNVFDPEDNIFVGWVLDLEDIVTFHGESAAELESNFQAAIDAYLSACQELVTAPEKPAGGSARGSGTT